MAHSKKKEELLNTQMRMLGLGGAFSNWFVSGFRKEYKSDITLKEFISLNSDLKANKTHFVVWRNEEEKEKIRHGFIKESKSFLKLKTFLLEKGFTHKDWIMLLPDIKTLKGMYPNLGLLERKTLKAMPFYKALYLSVDSRPSGEIREFFWRRRQEKDEPILVSDILSINKEDIDGGRLSYFKGSLYSIQQKFLSYGLKSKDGPFMKLNLAPKSENDYVRELVQVKGFSVQEAVEAVKIGIKAGWVKV